ncbi:MAG: aminodeoxychorismate synthase component I [Thiogranum sp.]|nr:aminodeoxychorismate synthase component I [Thiogranum sp.]
MHQVAFDTAFDLLDLHERSPRRYPHLLESSAIGPQGRYDILFAFPGISIELPALETFDFLSALDEAWKAEARPDTGVPHLPFHGGWFLYLGYELAGQIEPRLDLPRDASQLPLACATRFPAAVIYDRHTQARWIVSEQETLLRAILADIGETTASNNDNWRFDFSVREDPPQPYLDAVEKVLDYIREGDVFQVNLSRRWQTDWPGGVASAALYRRLRKANPGPFSGLATWGDNAVLCSSPERLIEARGDVLQTRPIAGTRPRGFAGNDDMAFSRELLGHPKERAEHIMLIDLERNDLGRIAVPGTVRVSELMVLESYATVHHIVSNVCARRRPGITPGDIIRAVFPGGTITGCPKVRCMEIIAELEGAGRGAYTGAMGYLNHDGSMDLNILIRTMVRSDDLLSFRAGAGIVADSIPGHELEETRFKARGMLAALQAVAE